MRWTWAVIGGVAALLGFAAVDSLRSSGKEPVASTTASTPTLAGNSTLPPCRDPRLSLRIEVSGKDVRLVARAEDACRFPALEPTLTIKDRTGKTLVEFAQPPVRIESLRPGWRHSVRIRLPNDMAGCREGGPFLAEASLGPYPVRRRFSGLLIDCPSPQERATDQARQAWTAAATRICGRAPDPEPRRSPNRTELEIQASLSRRAAHTTAYSLRRLSALAAPRVDRARIERMLSLMAEQVAALRLETAAAAAGDRVRARRLHAKAVGLAQDIDQALWELASLWDVRPELLWPCERLAV